MDASGRSTGDEVGWPFRDSIMSDAVERETMCMYCTFREDGWTALLDYDDVYQEAIAAQRARETNYGFYEDWDELREQVTPGTGR